MCGSPLLADVIRELGFKKADDFLGLYDRDELVLRKSTLEEAPKLFELSTLFSLLLWIGEQPCTSSAATRWPCCGRPSSCRWCAGASWPAASPAGRLHRRAACC